MDLSISTTQGGEAAAASNRTKRAFLALCVLLVASTYVSKERGRAGPEAALGQARPEVHEVAARYLRPGEAAGVAVRKVFYDRQKGVYCGEVNGRTSAGTEARFRDGVRIFVCGPGLHD